MSRPETKYAKSGDVHIAYQVVGDGPIDIVFVPWWWNHLEIQWEDPLVSRFLNRLGSFSRLLLFDQRGSGLSDPVPINGLPTLEQWMDDINAVMNAAGSERAAVFGHGDGGLVSILFAATYPDRTSSLVLADCYARVYADDGYPGSTPESQAKTMRYVAENWGSGIFVEAIAPDLVGDEEFRKRLARMERMSLSPGVAVAIGNVVYGVDIRPVLPTVSTPTLVLRRKDNRYVPAAWGKYLADHIPAARFVELPGAEHLYWLGSSDIILDEVQEFLTGQRPLAAADRVLATILFTDIVSSTEHAARLGDRAWRDVLDRFRTTVRDLLRNFNGREINTRGDDFFATFEGPARAIRCAIAITDSARVMGLGVRSGVHTG